MTMNALRKKIALTALFCGLAILTTAVPQRLTSEPVASPDKTRRASVEWEDVGYLGLLRMIIYNRAGEVQRNVELPQSSPEPNSLVWISNEWVGSESFIGERGGGFFFVHAPSGRGYLLEVFEPRPDADWIFTMRSTDRTSSAPVNTVSRGQTSLFPILLRDLPRTQSDYLSANFVDRFTHAVDVYNDFRRANKIHDIELRSAADIRPETGGIVLADVDRVPEIIYFPAGAATPEEMLTRVRRQALPEPLAKLLSDSKAPQVRIKWLGGGEFVVESTGQIQSGTTSTLHRGKFENVADAPYVAPTPATRVTIESDKTPAKSDLDEDEDESSERRDSERKLLIQRKQATAAPTVKVSKPSPAKP